MIVVAWARGQIRSHQLVKSKITMAIAILPSSQPIIRVRRRAPDSPPSLLGLSVGLVQSLTGREPVEQLDELVRLSSFSSNLCGARCLFWGYTYSVRLNGWPKG